MAVLGTSFQIGRSALAAYQAAISVTGHNIANVGNADYTRQSGRLAAVYGGPGLGGLSSGIGVRMDALQRHADQAVENRLRQALSDRGGAEAAYQSLTQVEALYNELTDQDLSTGLSEFFSAFASLQTDPSATTQRNLVLSAAAGVVSTLHRQRDGLVDQVLSLNELIEQETNRANAIADEIADLNVQVVSAEAGGNNSASALRDRRDALLRELSELMDIHVREQDSGAINVYVGSQPLVDFDRSRGLTVQRELDGGIEIASVRFTDNDGAVTPTAGELAGLISARDTYIADQIARLDQLAHGLIYEVNSLHSCGCGLVGYTQLGGTYAVDDPDAALNSDAAGLTFPVENGTFIVHVRDENTGQISTRQIEVDLDGLNGDDTTLSDLAAALDNIGGLNASVTSDNRLSIQTTTGSEVWFTEDTSGALAALGVATFFQGTTAANIEIRPELQADSRLIAASLSGEKGDGSNAGLLGSLGNVESTLLGNQSIQGFHATTINALAVTTAGAGTSYEAADAVYSSLTAQRESVSGVSLDEEAINLAVYEKAYQGASRYLSVVNDLAGEIMSLVS